MPFSAISRRAFSMRAQSLGVRDRHDAAGHRPQRRGSTPERCAELLRFRAACQGGPWRPGLERRGRQRRVRRRRHPRRRDHLKKPATMRAHQRASDSSVAFRLWWPARTDSTRVCGRRAAIDGRAILPHRSHLRMLPMSASGSAREHQQVGALAGFDRAELVEAARGDRAVARRGDDRLRRASCRARRALRWR